MHRAPYAVRNAVDHAKFRSRSHAAVIRVHDAAGNVIETHEHAGDSRSGEQCARIRSRTLSNIFSACSRRDSSLKHYYEIMGGHLNMKTQIPNINMVRSAWRRVKKDIKDAIIRDLKPVKDVKGGGGVTGKSKPTTGTSGTTGSQ